MTLPLTIAQEPRGIPGTEIVCVFDGLLSLSAETGRLADAQQVYVLDLGSTRALRHVLREVLGRIGVLHVVSLAVEPEVGITTHRLLALVHHLFPGEFTCVPASANGDGLVALKRRTAPAPWHVEPHTGLSVCLAPDSGIAGSAADWRRCIEQIGQVLAPGSWELLVHADMVECPLADLDAPVRVVDSGSASDQRGRRKNQLAEAAHFSDCLFLSVPVTIPATWPLMVAERAPGLTVATPQLRNEAGTRVADWIVVQADTIVDGFTALLDYRATSPWALTSGHALLARKSLLMAHPFLDSLTDGEDHELVRRLQRQGLDPVCLPLECVTLTSGLLTWPRLPYSFHVDFVPVAPPTQGSVAVAIAAFAEPVT